MMHHSTPSPDADAIALISRLAGAHGDAIRLAHAVWTSQEAMDRTELAASRAMEFAATCPWDDAAADRAVLVSRAYEQAAARESQATVEWAAHRLRVDKLLDEAWAVVDRACDGQSFSACSFGDGEESGITRLAIRSESRSAR